jgi:hypothetical protein
MSEETQEIEDIIEDVTEEELTANEELEQDLPEEVSEEQEVSFDDSIKSILLGEKKSCKEEDDEEESEEDEDEEEMEEGYMKASKSKKEESDDEEEEEDEDELSEDFMSALAIGTGAAVGLTGGLIGTLALISGVRKSIVARAAKKAADAKAEEEAAYRKAVADKQKKYNDEIQSIANKFDDDKELASMFKTVPAYMRGSSVKASKNNKERTKQLTKIAKYVKSKLDSRELKAFTDISKAIRDKHSSVSEAAKVEDEVDGEKVSVGVSQAIKKSAKAKAPEPTGKGAQTDDSEQDGEKAIDDTVKSIKKSTPAKKAKVAEALDLLMTNQAELSEDFKTEAATLFEAAIAERSLEIQERLEEKYNQERVEEVEALRESLIERIDSYLSYVVESWIEENTEQVENTLRTEIAENFISSLKDVFVENYIEVPTEKRDIVEELNTVAEETQEKLSESEKQVEALKEQIEAYERNEVLAEASSDLSENESTKLTAIVEDIEFTDKETFASKVGVIKSSLFNIKEESTLQDSVEDYQNAETEVIIEGEADPMEKLPSYMKAYVSALSSSK